MTSMQKSIFHRASSSQAIQTASVSGYTLCPRIDGPSGRESETINQFDTAVVVLSNCIYKDFVFFFAIASHNPVFVQVKQILSLHVKLLQNPIVIFLQITFVGWSVFYLSLYVARHPINSLSHQKIRQAVPGFQISLHQV